jgi:hypothetical protein
VTEPEDKIKKSWDAMREEERAERDNKIKQDIEQADRLSRTLAPEPEPED